MTQKLRIVCATRGRTEDFWSATPTGTSLVRLGVHAHDVSLFADNTAGLGECYNKAIEEACNSPSILVFMHDDLFIHDYFWRETVLRLLNSRFDVIGLAGNKRRAPNQPAWWCLDTSFSTLDVGNVHGAVGHGQDGWPPNRLDVYGPSEHEVKLLDGLFIAADSQVLLQKGVSFDPRFDFHMYDLDFSRQCERAGLRMGVAPISVVHAGAGRYDSQSWRDNYKRYQEKWHEGVTSVLNTDFLKELHKELSPRGYVEIGIQFGRSLSLASCDSLGIDPLPRVAVPLGNKTVVVAQESDEFFADEGRAVRFLPRPIDFAYIDGMHLSEFALRDFMNIETYANYRTVVCFDDVLPYDYAIASRNPLPGDWTGDVWKIMDVLKTYRPDLKTLLVNTRPTGTLVVYGLNPGDTKLWDHRQDIEKYLSVTTEMQVPTKSIIDREGAVSADHARRMLRTWLLEVELERERREELSEG